MDIKISEINAENFNPFYATEEELIANALSEAGLLTKFTNINGRSANELCHSFDYKRSYYRKSAKLGRLLVKNSIISPEQLKNVLDYQKENPGEKLGDALLSMNICTADDISLGLRTQTKLRSRIKPNLSVKQRERSFM